MPRTLVRAEVTMSLDSIALGPPGESFLQMITALRHTLNSIDSPFRCETAKATRGNEIGPRRCDTGR
jgi:hypothetical protein